ncbi:MAG TPA: hypothetical protein VNM92_11805 [Thermoanaerobaculia bacterium]|nr:hypothetical protein [Thermoanaerobaculia bacterium]
MSVLDISNFTTSDMMRARAKLREIRDLRSASMEEAAQHVVDYFYEQLRVGFDGPPACGLIRIFKTHPYGELDEDLQSFASAAMPGVAIVPATKCLTLLATRGEKPEWNSRHNSDGHRAIPLVSEEMVRKAPMVSRLISQLGLSIPSVLSPDPSRILEAQEKTYDIFHIADALDSPYLPAQDQFVKPYAIKSVLGFGGILPSGDFFATIMFSKVSISAGTAQLFAPLALNVKICLLPFNGGVVFEG